MRWWGIVTGLFMITVIGLGAWFGPAKILVLAIEGTASAVGLGQMVHERIMEFDPTKGPLALLVAVATILAAVLPVWLHYRPRDGASAASREVPGLQPPDAHRDAAVQSVDRSQLLPAAESITAYLDQLEALLKESAAREHFVLLKAEEGAAPRPFPFLIQKVEQRDALGARPIDLLRAHKDLEQYVLLGPPGSGKSTCLERLVLDLIDAYRKDPEHEYIPVFCSLARWTNKRLSALDLLKQSVAQLTGPRNRLADELEEYLAQGRLVVILDALNEMPNRVGSGRRGEDDAVVSRGQQFAGNVASGQLLGIRVDSREESVRELASSRGVRSHFVLSCRTHEFAGSLNWRRVHLLPMEADQIHEFLRNYLPEDHESLSKILSNNRSLFELARNPFYLRLLTVVFDQDLTKVGTPGQFLVLLLETLLRRERERRGDGFDEDAFQCELGKLAFDMIDRDMIGSKVDLRKIGYLKDEVAVLGVDTGLLVETSEGGITFYHHLVQEFFAALALSKKYVRRSLRTLVRAEKWMETLVLYHGISEPRANTGRLLLHLLRQRNGFTFRPIRPLWTIPIMFLCIVAWGFLGANLLIDWLSGGGWFSSTVQQAPLLAAVLCLGLPLFVSHLVPTISYHRRGIWNTAYVLSQIRDPEFQRISVPAMVEAFSRLGVFREKLVDALVEVGNPAVEWLITGLQSKKPNVRRGCIEALGRLRAPAAVEPLIATLQQGDPQYFIATVEALGQFDDPRCRSAIALSLEVIEPRFRVFAGAGKWTEVLSKLAHTDPSLALSFVNNTARDQPRLVRHFAILGLGAYGHPAALPTLERIGRDSDDPLRGLALKSLAKLDSPEVVTILLEIVEKTPEIGPKGDAVIALGAIKSNSAVNALLPLLDHHYWWIRDAALKSLGRLRQPSSVPAILDRLVALQRDSGRELADTLGRIGSPETFDGLVKLCRDPRKYVREQALFMLDHVFPTRSGPLFIDLLRDPSYPDRPALLALLVAAPPAGDEFRQLLLELRHDSDEEVAVAAVAAHNRLDKGLEQRLKQLGVALGGTRLGNLARRIVEWSGWADYERVKREIELTTDSEGFATGVKINQLAYRDPEIGLALRRPLRILIAASLVGIFMIGALPVLLWRPISGLGQLAIAYWPWALGVAGAAGASYIPGLRQLRRVRWIGVVVALLRAWLIVLPLALTARYGPGGLTTGVGWLGEGIWWAGDQLWHFKLWSGALVITAILLAAVGARAPQPIRALRGLILLVAVLVAVVGLFSLALLYWYATVGIIVVALLAAVLISRRVTRAKRRARIRSLQSAYAVAASGQLPLALETDAPGTEGDAASGRGLHRSEHADAGEAHHAKGQLEAEFARQRFPNAAN